MSKPRVHLICNAHLDPVWQWRWEEGCAETLSTFSTAVDLLHEHDQLIFNHNESVLYQWTETYAPELFKKIRELVTAGRWSISGGWYLQPDANLPGLESFIRHISVGRQYFQSRFGARPRVAYNFDSFGHHGGLPQILSRAGYEMYVHMRPEKDDLDLPADLYRWQGVDGSEILALRIAVGLYHTERDNIEQRLREGVDMALRLNRDVPVFWGLGNHGGGATREDLAKIDAFVAEESRVDLIHSTPDHLMECLKPYASDAPVVRGDIQRVFTGCYTSLSRLKRRARTSLSKLVQCETLRASSWWLNDQEYPRKEFDDIWCDHLFNDFHDILPGTCTKLAEQDALDLYGSVSDSVRRLRFGAIVELNNNHAKATLPVTLANTNPALTCVPVEVEFMVDHRPLWAGTWHTRIFKPDGTVILSQEEQPDARLPFNGWRRKLSFMAELTAVGVSNFYIEKFEGLALEKTRPPPISHELNSTTGLIDRLGAELQQQCLIGPLLQPIVVEDTGDSWGTGMWNYRDQAEYFQLQGKPKVVEQGPVRTITESEFTYSLSRLRLQTVVYSDWPRSRISFSCRLE